MNVRKSWALLLGWTLCATPVAAQDAAGTASNDAEAEVVVVRITDDGFRPATVTVEHGAIVRYLQLSSMPHNVEFVRVPEGARMAPEFVPSLTRAAEAPTTMPPLRFGPYLIEAGETYDVRVDEYLAAGLYEYRCASHDYRGLLLVLDEWDL